MKSRACNRNNERNFNMEKILEMKNHVHLLSVSQGCYFVN